MVLKAPRTTPSHSLLNKLHWLPIASRIDYKIASLSHKILQTKKPEYLYSQLKVYVSNREIRSPYQNTLVKPRTHLALTNKAFFVASPQVWNSLHLDLRTTTSTNTFHKLLKVNLFNLNFG